MTFSLLILGGTTEARTLAARLAGEPAYACTLSLAGRTREPSAQPVPMRVGGFGGIDGLAAYLEERKIDLLIDATHPYAARISANAVAAAARAGVPMLALRRPGWTRLAGDCWHEVDSVTAAVAALGAAPRRVFVALGRNELAPFEDAPQHHYLVRSVDPVEPPLALPRCDYLTARGPFAEADEEALLRARSIEMIVSKNSGGSATHGKIAAARRLGIAVVMIRRPVLPRVAGAADVAGLVAMIPHALSGGHARGE